MDHSSRTRSTIVWRMGEKEVGRGPIRVHDIRHLHASGLLAAGCDVVTIQRALGHSSATTTLNTYSHLWPTAEDRTRTKSAGDVTADSVRTTAQV